MLHPNLDGVWVNFIARARTATAIKDERMHGRARILEDQWRHVQTRDSESKRGELRIYVCMYVYMGWAQNRADERVDDTWKCCSDCISYCGNAAVPVYSCPRKYFMQVGEEGFQWITHARDTLYGLKLSGYQKLAVQLKPTAHLGRVSCGRKGWFIISTMSGLHLDCLNLSGCDSLFLPVTTPARMFDFIRHAISFLSSNLLSTFHSQRKWINNLLSSYITKQNVNFSYIICIQNYFTIFYIHIVKKYILLIKIFTRWNIIQLLYHGVNNI